MELKLGGFKILKDVVWISLIWRKEDESLPLEFCRLLASEMINLSLVTFGTDDRNRGMDIVIGAEDRQKISQVLEQGFAEEIQGTSEGAVLSIFPHRTNPEITGILLDLFDRKRVHFKALAHSNSTVSTVLTDEAVDTATGALFECFQFGAYRTPADWKLAQVGKEKLYKEVVASFQEKRPKIYSLDWWEAQNLMRVQLDHRDLGTVGRALRDFAGLGLCLNFMVSSPAVEKGEANLHFCLPESEKIDYPRLLDEYLPGVPTAIISPAALFCMNGPHFGDRYGLVSQVLSALDHAEVELLALGCTVASINGVVRSGQIGDAIRAIEKFFEVPSVNRRT